MFKCCVCHGKSSRRTSQEEDDDDDSDMDQDEEEDEEEEREVIQSEMADKYKCQISNIPKIEEVCVEVNGDLKKNGNHLDDIGDNKEAIKEEVSEILNCAVKIVSEIKKGERERLEKIKEESADENSLHLNGDAEKDEAEETKCERKTEVEAKVNSEEKLMELVEKTEAKEQVDQEVNKEIENCTKDERIKSKSPEILNGIMKNGVNEEEEVEAKIAEPEERCVIVDGIKKSEVEAVIAKDNELEEMIIEELKFELNEEADNDQELKEIVHEARVSKDSSPVNDNPGKHKGVEIIFEIKKVEIKSKSNQVNSMPRTTPEPIASSDDLIRVSFDNNKADGLLFIPPPEETDYDRIEDNNVELDFPTPPPIDFDVSENENSRSAPWDDTLTISRSDKSHSPDCKSLPSLPSPPSPVSDSEVESNRSSSSERRSKLPLLSCQRITDNISSEDRFVESTLGVETEEVETAFDDRASPRGPPNLEDIPPRPEPPVPRWLSQEDEEPDDSSEIIGGMQEPPATPVARDELAMRRHRFFSDLLQAARRSTEHRVTFDPLGPLVHTGCEHDDREEHLEELVNRLETVTKRLEKVSTNPQVQTQEIAVQTKSPSPERSNSIEDPSSQSSSSSRESTVSAASVVEVVKDMSVAGFQDIVSGSLQDYLQLSQKIGGDVAEHSKLVDSVFKIQLQFIQLASMRPAPSNQSEQVSLLGPTSTKIQDIQDFRDKHRSSQYFNHLSAISESIPALGWVAVTPTPAPYIKEMNDAGQFYTNRVLKDWKEKDKTHVEWCKAWVKTLADLQQYVRQHHTTGLVWSKTGSATSGGAVPPPPPPCMMPMADPVSVIGDDRSALFAEINQGEAITKNLKKVTSDMQTHKNSSLRTGPAPFKAPIVNNSNSPSKTVLPANAPITKPPVFTRDGKKWLVENHKGNSNLLIDNTEMNNVIYMYHCQESTLVVKGKINSIVMDSCRKSSVVFDSVVSCIEFVNCQSVQMQVLGTVPTISIDKTDGCQMYLNKESLNVEMITSKSSEMNVMVPTGSDYVEYPVPEQFKTVITNKGLNTIAVDSLG